MRSESRCHDQLLASRTIFIVAPDRPPSGTPVVLIVPGTRAALEPLAELVRDSLAQAAAVVFDTELSGPDAESALIDHWTEMDEDTRSRVRASVGPLVGVLARFPNLHTTRFAFLSHASETEPTAPNSQSRSLLMALAADTWSLALDDAPPVDAQRWRTELRTAVESYWNIAFVDGIADAVRTAASVPGLKITAAAAQRTLDRHSTHGHHTVSPRTETRGWLDRELFARDSAPASGVPVMTRMVSAGERPTLADKVLRGRNGRLFLARDSHDSHRQITGARPLTSAELDAWDSGTADRLSSLHALDCHFRQVIGPAPQAVHPADLPAGLRLAPDRPVQQVLDRLRATHQCAHVVYPIDTLRQATSFRDPFSKTDSHWNDLGTYLGYETLCDSLGKDIPMRQLTRDEVSFHETCYVGDLGDKLSPRRASIFLRARIENARARATEDNRVRNHGRRAVFECEAAPPTTCMVFGDSWAYSLMLFIAESFRRVVFCHRVNVVDHDAVALERPDVVLSVMTERFCTALPLDRTAVAFDLVAAKKIAAHDLVPVPMPGSPHNYLFSLELDRGLKKGTGLRLPPRL